MAVHDILPKTNLKLEDIRDTLNAAGGSVGNETRSYFGINANLNMFSRYKPMRQSGDFINLWENNAWKGIGGKCGINFTEAVMTTYKDVIGKASANSYNGWKYDMPLGSKNSPFRLGDFRGYYPDALPPVTGFSVPGLVSVNGKLQAMVAYSPSLNDPDGDDSYAPGNIGLSEFAYNGDNFSDFHFGIVVTDTSNNYKGRSFSGGSGLTSCEYATSGLIQGTTYRAWPLIAKTAMGQYDADVANTYIMLPLCGPDEFKVVSAEEANGLKIALTCEYSYLGNTKASIRYTLTVSTESTAPTLMNNYITMRFSTSGVNDAMMAGEKREKLPDISVTKNTPYTKVGFFDIDSAYSARSYYLYLTLQSGKYTQKIYPQEIMVPEL